MNVIKRKQDLIWRYCVVGNIVKIRVDDEGVLRYGTKEFTGGTKVYLCGKYWNANKKTISAIGKTRGGRYGIGDVLPSCIENIRCSKEYKPAVMTIMNNHEFYHDWWGNTEEDKQDTERFVREWKEAYNLKEED